MGKKVMIVTGGSDGLGKVCVEYFMNKYQVVVLSRSCDKIQSLIDNGSILWIACDIANTDNVQAAINSIVDQCGRIDVLVNNAGFWIQGKLTDCDDESIKITIEVNLLGQIYVTKYCVPYLEQTKGVIININSQSGLYKKTERSVYHASKRGMTGFGKSISDELQSLGIRVCNMFPAMINTGFFEKQGIIKDRSRSIEPLEIVKMIEFVVTMDPKYTIPEFGIDNM